MSCTFFTAWSCKMLMRAAIMTHNHSYENLGEYGEVPILYSFTSWPTSLFSCSSGCVWQLRKIHHRDQVRGYQFNKPLSIAFINHSIIGLNLGTCIAFFVIIGDLAPPIVAQFFGLNWVRRNCVFLGQYCSCVSPTHSLHTP